jgi:hypothetical protein
VDELAKSEMWWTQELITCRPLARARHIPCIFGEGVAKTTSRRKTGTKKKAAKRILIDTTRDKRFVRRASAGKFKESDDVAESLASDPRTSAKRTVGQGDKGDR